MSFGGRFREDLDRFENNLNNLNHYEEPYCESICHFDETEVLSQMKVISKLLIKTIEKIEKQKESSRRGKSK